MRVKLLSVPSGSGFDSLRAGDEVDFPPEDAVRLIRHGLAVPAAPPVERAVKPEAVEVRENMVKVAKAVRENIKKSKARGIS